MQYLGLLFEFILLLFGIYLYMFAIGAVQSRNIQTAQKAEAFRQENGRWMRLAALAIIAITFINVLMGLRALWP